MSLPAFQTTVVNGTGDILTAATVTVTVESTGAAAVLFSDRNGTIGLGSGGVFSVNGTTAFAQFFAAPGEYRIEANDAVSGFSETWRYQVLSGTAAVADLGLLAGNALAADDINANGDVWGAGNVEYGSNANGEYWKYPDGLLICTFTATVVSASITFSVDGNFIFDPTLSTFPNTGYISNPSVETFGLGATAVAWSTGFAINLLNTSIRIICGASAVTNITYGYTATGKWK